MQKKQTHNKLSVILIPFLVLSFSLSLVACQTKPTASTKLRMALIPVLDTLPMYVAQQEGLFEKHNVNVEFIPVGSAPERDQVIASGQADGMVNETLSTMFANKETTELLVVRFARAATKEVHLFSILAAANSGIDSIESLKGIEIGISQGTIIEYLTDRLLQAEGIKPEEIKTTAVPKIDVRLSLLASGELKAATLPEPATTLAIQQGAQVIIDDTRHPEFSHSVITFRKAVTDEYPEAIRAFLSAIEEAVEKINANPSQYNSLLIEKNLIPPPLAGSFQTPAFVTAGVPSEAQWNDVMQWAIARGLLEKSILYNESVTDQYLP